MLKILYLVPAPLIPIKLTFPVFPAWLHFGHSQQFGSSSLTTPSDSFTCGRDNNSQLCCTSLQEGDDHSKAFCTAPCFLEWTAALPGEQRHRPAGAEQALGAAQPPLNDAGRWKEQWPNTSDKGLSSGLSMKASDNPNSHTVLLEQQQKPPRQPKQPPKPRAATAPSPNVPHTSALQRPVPCAPERHGLVLPQAGFSHPRSHIH